MMMGMEVTEVERGATRHSLSQEHDDCRLESRREGAPQRVSWGKEDEYEPSFLMLWFNITITPYLTVRKFKNIILWYIDFQNL